MTASDDLLSPSGKAVSRTDTKADVRRPAVLPTPQWKSVLLAQQKRVFVCSLAQGEVRGPLLSLLASSRLETGAVHSDGETSLVLAATGAPFWDCLKILGPEFSERAVEHFDTLAHSALADMLY